MLKTKIVHHIKSFSNKRQFFATCNYSNLVSRRTKPNNSTVLDSLVSLKNNLPHRDAIMVSSQNTKWTVDELDIHSDAFANYLIEAGFQHGSKVMLWGDINHTLELMTAMIGSIKAGCSLVVSEYENWEDIKRTLIESKSNLLLLSPYVKVEGNKNRIDFLNEFLPELDSMRSGHTLNLSQVPNLKQIIQISHKTVNGTNKFKNSLNYVKPKFNNLQYPVISSSDKVFEIYGHNETISYNHIDILSKFNGINDSLKLDYSSVINSAPIFYPSSFVYGLLANLATKSYTVLPGNYNFNEILKLLQSQLNANTLFCEGPLLNVKLTNDLINPYTAYLNEVRNVVVFSNKDDVKTLNTENFKRLFKNANFHFYDEFNLNLI